MFKSLLSISSLFLVLAMSGCSSCVPEPSHKSSSKSSQKDPKNSEAYPKPGTNSNGTPKDPSGNKGHKYSHTKDPRETVDAQKGLCNAVLDKDESNIVYFLKKGGRIDGDCPHLSTKDASGFTYTFTPITMVLRTDTSHIFEILIEHSSATAGDILPWRFEGNTYLHYAVAFESERATELLAKRSYAFIDVKNWAGYTSLIVAIHTKNALRLVEILLENGANPNLKASYAGVVFYPADLAAALNKYDVVDLLKKYGGKSSAAGSPNPTKADFINNCFAEFLPGSNDLKKQHLALKAQIENSRQCQYAAFEDVLAGNQKLSDVGCRLPDSIKKDYEKFSAEFHRSLRSNAAKFAADHCRNQTNADAGVCNDTHTRFNACMGLAKNGKNIDAL